MDCPDGAPPEGRFVTEWATSSFPCRECYGRVLTRIWQAPDGAYERVYMRCNDCRADWYINGGPREGKP